MTTPTLRFDFGSPVCFVNPTEIIAARTLAEVRPALRAVEAATDTGFWAAGYVAYEAAPAFDSAMHVHSTDSDLPLVWFGIFEAPHPADIPVITEPFVLADWQPGDSRDEYDKAIQAIHASIAAGDVYQVNHTFRLHAPLSSDASPFPPNLRAPYAADLDLGRFRIISASPELFFHQNGRQITTRPMKGTRPRGRWVEEDADTAAELRASEKDRAENVMIVDLLRNDLGRIAVVGSVQVSQLFQIERYPTVHQMTSTVAAALRPEITLEETFAALFPCGSVTGAPKISAMRQISQLEASPRQVYCGAIGYVAPQGEAIFNVAIRTALLDRKTETMTYGVGGGIVWDSTSHAEYQEALSKAALLAMSTPPFELLETLRWQDGEFALWTRHLDRLTASAAYFGFFVPREDVAEALRSASHGWNDSARRVRLRVSCAGELTVESTLLTPLSGTVQRVALALTPVSRDDPFLCHKTTNRAVYDNHRARQPNCFDVLLWNEDGELTEFTIGNLVVEQEGRFWTPPRQCGLLNGTFRDELLATGQIGERVLRREALDTASRLWLINSVRGFVRVHFLPEVQGLAA